MIVSGSSRHHTSIDSIWFGVIFVSEKSEETFGKSSDKMRQVSKGKSENRAF